MRKWEVVSSEVVNQNPWMTVICDKCMINEDGETYGYYWIDVRDFVVVVGTTEDGQVVLIEQYRHGAKDIFTEFPAGLIEDREDPVESAKRELFEETGYGEGEFVLKKVIYSAPAALNSKGYLFFAKNLKKVGTQHLEPTENIKVKLVHFDQLSQMIEEEKIEGAFGLASTLLAIQNRDWFLG